MLIPRLSLKLAPESHSYLVCFIQRNPSIKSFLQAEKDVSHMKSVENNVSSILFFDTKLVFTFNLIQLWKKTLLLKHSFSFPALLILEGCPSSKQLGVGKFLGASIFRFLWDTFFFFSSVNSEIIGHHHQAWSALTDLPSWLDVCLEASPQQHFVIWPLGWC